MDGQLCLAPANQSEEAARTHDTPQEGLRPRHAIAICQDVMQGCLYCRRDLAVEIPQEDVSVLVPRNPVGWMQRVKFANHPLERQITELKSVVGFNLGFASLGGPASANITVTAGKEDFFDILLRAVGQPFVLLEQGRFEFAAAFVNRNSVADMGSRSNDAWQVLFPLKRVFKIPNRIDGIEQA